MNKGFTSDFALSRYLWTLILNNVIAFEFLMNIFIYSYSLELEWIQVNVLNYKKVLVRVYSFTLFTSL